MRNTLTKDQLIRWYPCFDIDAMWSSICGESDTVVPKNTILNMSGKITPEQLVWVAMRPEVLEDSEMLALSAWFASEYSIEDQHDPMKMRTAAWAVVKVGAASEEELKSRWDLLNTNIFNRIVEFAV
jgi:hypothetical protein